MTLKTLRIPAKQIFRIKMFLKRAIKRSDFTKRLIWFNVFPHLPLSKKSKGIRMGKGVGKLSTWCSQIYGGSIIFEFQNLRIGRAFFFYKQINFKVSSKNTIIFFKTKVLKFSHIKKLNSTVTFFF